MRTNTPALSAFTVALSLYASALLAGARAEPLPAREHRLSDQNLFEVHLQRPSSSHKRLPSEILKEHHERDEIFALPEEAPSSSIFLAAATPTTTPSSSSSSTSSLTTSPSSSASTSVASVAPLPPTSSSTSTLTSRNVEVTFTPKQPSHFIRHRRMAGGRSHGKRRLSSESDLGDEDEEPAPAVVTIAKDSDELSPVWEMHTLLSRFAARTADSEADIEDIPDQPDLVAPQP